MRRDEAIERFDAFLARYPNNPKYTPDALFRLAELHFEKSNEAYVAKLEAYDAHLEDYDAGRVDDLDPEPVQDYARTIELFELEVQSVSRLAQQSARNATFVVLDQVQI